MLFLGLIALRKGMSRSEVRLTEQLMKGKGKQAKQREERKETGLNACPASSCFRGSENIRRIEAKGKKTEM